PDAAELILLASLKAEVPPEVFTTIFEPPASRADGYDRENLLKASKLLDEAGWVLKNQQRVNAQTGKPLRFELLLASGGNHQWVLLFQHNLERLGVKMDIRQIDTAQITTRLSKRDYDMMPTLWKAQPWPSSSLQISWASEYI